jgi:aryl-alcohol dehydrogenase-like predicted oxidoreductase
MVLIDYNLLQIDRETVIAELNNAGIGVVAGTVLAQGHLIPGKIGSIKSAADIWYLARSLLKPTSRKLSKNSGAMRDAISGCSDMTAVQAAFSYVLSNQAISSCIFGTTKVPNLLEGLDAANKILDSECKAIIQRVFNELPEKVSA